MKRLRKYGISLIMGLAMVLLGVALKPVETNAASELSSLEYNIPDIRTGETRVFDGDDGKPKVLLFGGISTCGICASAEDNINSLIPKIDMKSVDIYFIDIKNNSLSSLRSYARSNDFSSEIYMGSTTDNNTYNLYSRCYWKTIAGGYTMPLLVYVDGQGTIVSYTTGTSSMSTIKSNLTKLGISYDGSKKPVYGTGIYEYNGGLYLFENGRRNTTYEGLYYAANLGGIYVYLLNGRVCLDYEGLYYDPVSDNVVKLAGGIWDQGYTDLYCDPNAGWFKVSSGILDYYYTGLYCSPTMGWWKIESGMIDFTYNDLYCDPAIGWWKISGGTIDWGYEGLYCSPTLGWWKITGGTIDFAYTELYCDPVMGWWKINGGTIDLGYTGLFCSPTYGWWLVSGGGLALGYNGLYCDAQYGWWLVSGGGLALGYSGLYCDAQCGWWKINGGTIDFGYNDLYFDPTVGWWKVNGGTIDFGYTGLYCSPAYGWWLVQFGMLNTSYTGYYADPLYGTYYLVNGYIDFYHVD